MAIIVQKFGGTSVGNPDKIKAVAQRVLGSHKQGNKMVVVLSAMSGETNRLIELAHAVQQVPDLREMDMLVSTGEQITVSLFAMAVKEAGCDAVSLLGDQVSIRTSNMHTKARIKDVATRRINKHLDNDKNVVISEYKVATEQGKITTLGRGGSDTNESALVGRPTADR